MLANESFIPLDVITVDAVELVLVVGAACDKHYVGKNDNF